MIRYLLVTDSGPAFVKTSAGKGGEYEMEKMMKECMRPHALIHIASGAGLGLLLAGLFGGAAATLGVILLVGGLIADVSMQKK